MLKPESAYLYQEHIKGYPHEPLCRSFKRMENKKLLGVDIKAALKKLLKITAQSGELNLILKYFIDKKSPVTKLSAPMCYDCSFEGKIDGEDYKFILGAKVPVTTLCPCSKEISEYGAHNQRALISVKVSYDETEQVWLEDLIELVESCASCPLHPLLKRQG